MARKRRKKGAMTVAEAGAKGGSVTGESKRRGDYEYSEYYRNLAKLRWDKKKAGNK